MKPYLLILASDHWFDGFSEDVEGVIFLEESDAKKLSLLLNEQAEYASAESQNDHYYLKLEEVNTLDASHYFPESDLVVGDVLQGVFRSGKLETKKGSFEIETSGVKEGDSITAEVITLRLAPQNRGKYTIVPILKVKKLVRE